MANFVYDNAKLLLLKGDLDFDEAGHDIRVRLVMTNTTADTEKDKTTVGGFTTFDEFDGASYAAQAIGTQSCAVDGTNNRGEFTGANVTFSTLGAGTRNCQAAILVKYVDGTTGDIPIAYIDTGGFPFQGNGGNVTIQWNAEGIIQTT